MAEFYSVRSHIMRPPQWTSIAPPHTPNVTKLRGDRNGDLSALALGAWDAVVDTCGFFPKQVQRMAEALHPHVPHYVFVSSVNQYSNFSVPGIDETHPSNRSVFTPDVELTPLTYGPLKFACEEAVRHIYSGHTLILRPGCMVGPYDQAHRFTYWTQRTAVDGPILVPGTADQNWQIIDVRDVTQWIAHMLEERHSGTYNVVGPNTPYSAQTLISELIATFGSDALPIWVDTDFLHRVPEGKRWLDLAEWADLPNKLAYLYDIDNTNAVTKGLRFRPLSETIRDVTQWLVQRPASSADAIDIQSEYELLSAWQ